MFENKLMKLVGGWPRGLMDTWNTEFYELMNHVDNMEEFSVSHGLNKGYDIERADDAVHIYIPVPGLDESDLNIESKKTGNRDILILSTTDKAVEENKCKFSGKIYVSYVLPQNAKTDGIAPVLEKGILKITVPIDSKLEDSKKINIKKG